jgi:hypothetical protein
MPAKEGSHADADRWRPTCIVPFFVLFILPVLFVYVGMYRVHIPMLVTFYIGHL